MSEPFFDPDKLLRRYDGIFYARAEHPDKGEGYIVWRYGTGLNVELLHLKVSKPGHGTATKLLQDMLRRLKQDPPWATVFGFTRVNNESAQGFYSWAGFDLSVVKGVYADGEAMLFSARYDDLCARHLGEAR